MSKFIEGRIGDVEMSPYSSLRCGDANQSSSTPHPEVDNFAGFRFVSFTKYVLDSLHYRSLFFGATRLSLSLTLSERVFYLISFFIGNGHSVLDTSKTRTTGISPSKPFTKGLTGDRPKIASVR